MQSLYLSDITLKLAQRPTDGCALSFREKIETAKLLDRLEVSAIELSPIENVKIDSLLDAETSRRIAERFQAEHR